MALQRQNDSGYAIDGAQAVKPMHVAMAAGGIATALAVIAFLVGFLLPEPKNTETKN